MPRPASAQRLLLTGTSPNVFGPGPTPFVAQAQSLDFDGSSETLKSGTQSSIQIADNFTIAMWIRPRSQPIGSGRSLLRIAGPTGQAINISTRASGAVPANDGIQLIMSDTGGIIRQNVAWGTPLAGPENCWRFVVVQWAGFGSTRACYVDAVNLGAGSNFTNSALVLVDGSRTVAFSEFNATTGPQFDGPCAYIALFSDVAGLDAAAIAEIYNGGDIDFDLLTDQGNYGSAAFLEHWWELGKKAAPDLAADSVSAAAFNLTDAATGISDADRVVDVPQAPQSMSIDFDGNLEALRNSTSQAIGIANTWALGIWFQPDTTADTQSIVAIRPSSGAGDDILVQLNATNDRVRVFWFDTGGVGPNGDASWNNTFVDNTWTFLLFFWNGFLLQFFQDGVSQGAPDVGVNNPALTMADSNRIIGVGNGQTAGDNSAVDGPISQVALWRVDVTGAATELYAGGDPNCLDLNVEFDSYTFQGDLAHWWRCGHEASPNLGKDFALAGFTPTIDIETNAQGIDDSDRLADVPT